jgi:steroid delta-isomerase-like uncharacterized protein
MTAERSEEVMRRYLTEVVAQGKFELIEELAAEDMQDHTQSIPGRAGLERHVRGFRETLPDVEVTVERIIATENEAIGIWKWRGTHSKQMFGVPATGRTVECRACSIFMLRDGMLVDYEVFSESLSAVRQMGVPIELPAASGART